MAVPCACASGVEGVLRPRDHVLRLFDVGGTGTKTALIHAVVLLDFLATSVGRDAHELAPELPWLEPPRQLGLAPGDAGYAVWLLESLPSLSEEAADERVVFGISTAGQLNHTSGRIGSWYGGGHYIPRHAAKDELPHIAALFGLPPERTFAVHDGTAHLLACGGRPPPLPPELAAFAVGTGVAFGMTDEQGLPYDRSTHSGQSSLALRGVSLSGAPYHGTFRSWLRESGSDQGALQAAMEEPFAGVDRPWYMPWVSLVLGSRGLKLAMVAFPPDIAEDGTCSTANADDCLTFHAAFAQQWLHFLHIEFLPHFTGRVRQLCFAGGVTVHNWEKLANVLVCRKDLLCGDKSRSY